MLIAGTLALGVVWGWLLVRICRGRPWIVPARMVLGVLAQAAVIAVLTAPIGVLWFAGGAAAGVALGAIWVLSLERRTSAD